MSCRCEAGQMVQQLRVFAALAENWGSVPSSHMWLTTCSSKRLTSVSGARMSSSSFIRYRHACGIHTHVGKHSYA